jgi:hypothetical protein
LKINKGVPQELLFYAHNTPSFPTLWYVSFSYVPIMISSDTPYKLAEIIRLTWPGLYRPVQDRKDFPTNTSTIDKKVV